jgi:NAD(P)H-hydrate epimerase
MLGAPALAAIAAFRAGCGLVRVACPAPIAHDVLTLCPSATGIALATDPSGAIVTHEASGQLSEPLANADAVVVGPGMGMGMGMGMGSHQGADASATSARAPRAPHATLALALQALRQSQTPVVVDADALNALALAPDLTRDLRAPAVLTPHPGEFRRLGAALAITRDPIDPSSRPAAAEELAQRLGCIVVLKGAGTVVTNGHDTWVCERAHACLATAGTGDVLAGLLGGLLAQWSASRGAPPLASGPSTNSAPPVAGASAPAASPQPARTGHVPRIATGEAMSKERLMALAAAKLGRPAPTASNPEAAPPSSGASVASIMDIVRLGVEAHALAGERWASTRAASAGLLAMELADTLPAVLEEFRK